MLRWSGLIAALGVASTAMACNIVLGINEGAYRGDGGSPSQGGAGGATGGGGTTATGGGGQGGSAGARACPPWDVDMPCESSLMDDADNCCYPGRSCEGGSCMAGRCAPVLLDDNASTDTRGIDVSGARIYWSTGGNQLIKSRVTDGTDYLEVASDTNYMPSLTTDATYAYWTEWNAGEVRRAPLVGGGPSELLGTVANATAGWGRIDVSESLVFWATKNNSIGVWASPIDPVTQGVFAVASSDTLALSVQEVADPVGVVVDETHVYFSDESAAVILRRLIDSVVAEEDIMADVVASNQNGAGDLAVDDAYVYWVAGGDIRRRAKDGTGSVETVASGQDQPNALVVDDVWVAWVNRGSAMPPTGTVARARKEGGAVETLAGAQKGPWEIAQSCTAVFWTNHNDFGVGEVWKVVK